MKTEFENIEEFIESMNRFDDVIFEWKGVAYFIDCINEGGANRYTHRRIGVFDLKERTTIVSTLCLYNLDINDMLDNHYIDGERLRDIIMDAKLLDLY